MISRQQAQERLRNLYIRKPPVDGTIQKTLIESGVSKRYFIDIRKGRKVPSLSIAHRIAEVSGNHELLRIIRDYRTKLCENSLCRKEYVDETPSNLRHFCSASCRVLVQRIRVKGVRTSPQRGAVAERRLMMYIQVIATMCHSCEPEGLCRNGDCPLRAVSPLPLIKPR